MKEGLVNIMDKTCSCRVFQFDQFVCAHAITVCLYLRVDPISLCSHHYTTEALPTAYSEPVIPSNEMAKWKIPENIQMMQLKPPDVPSCPGRRKTIGILSRGNDAPQKTIICRRCGERGHNNKTCKNPILVN